MLSSPLQTLIKMSERRKNVSINQYNKHSVHDWSCAEGNDLTIGEQNLNLLSQPNVTPAPQVRQARASCENLNYVTLAPQARPGDEILNYSLSHYSDILSKIIGLFQPSQL